MDGSAILSSAAIECIKPFDWHRSLMDDIYFVYQPIFDTRSHKPFSYETLIRSRTRSMDDVLKGLQIRSDREFYWRTSLTAGLTELVRSGTKAHVSVNCYQDDVAEDWFLQTIFDVLEITKANPKQLTIELTEHDGIEVHTKTHEVLQIIRKAGISIALDDFGIKHGNLDTLCFMPVNEIKIDGKFIRHLENARCARAIEYLVNYAKAINVDVVVEHIETRRQVRELAHLGVRLMQGFFFSEGKPEIEGQQLITKIYGEKIADTRLNHNVIALAAGEKRGVA